MDDRLRRIARRLDRGLLPFMGPSQIGAGYAEQPYRGPAAPTCPVCRRAMADHAIERSDDPARPTRLHCPV